MDIKLDALENTVSTGFGFVNEKLASVDDRLAALAVILSRLDPAVGQNSDSDVATNQHHPLRLEVRIHCVLLPGPLCSLFPVPAFQK